MRFFYLEKSRQLSVRKVFETLMAKKNDPVKKELTINNNWTMNINEMHDLEIINQSINFLPWKIPISYYFLIDHSDTEKKGYFLVQYLYIYIAT